MTQDPHVGRGHVGVFGPGPVGMTSALVLARLGFQVHLIGVPHPKSQLPRATRLDADASNLMAELDVTLGRESDHAIFNLPDLRVWSPDGSVAASTVRGTPGASDVVIPQEDFEQRLHSACLETGPSIRFHTGRFRPRRDPAGAMTLVGEDSWPDLSVEALWIADGSRSTSLEAANVGRTTLWENPWSVLSTIWTGRLLDPGWPAGVRYELGFEGRRVSAVPLTKTRDRFALTWETPVGTTAESASSDLLRRLQELPDVNAEGTFGERRVWRPAMTRATSFSGAGVVFLGDAAHTFPPGGGRGLNCGLGDVAHLASLMRQPLGLRQAMGQYATERRGTVQRVQQKLLAYFGAAGPVINSYDARRATSPQP